MLTWDRLIDILLLFDFRIACFHDQNKSGFFEGPAFNQPIGAIYKIFKNL